jgi:hypothetical protein
LITLIILDDAFYVRINYIQSALIDNWVSEVLNFFRAALLLPPPLLLDPITEDVSANPLSPHPLHLPDIERYKNLKLQAVAATTEWCVSNGGKYKHSPNRCLRSFSIKITLILNR